LLPRAKDLRTETTLVVLTDRRMYYIRLQSDPDRYVARLAFQYPPPGAANWDEYHAKRAAEEVTAAQEVQEASSLAATIPTVPIVSADWNYRMRGDSRIRPVAIASDGKQTYLRMPAGLASRGLPALMIEGQVANYRVQGDWWVVDGVAESGELLVGTGWRQRRAEFWKEAL
jgi:type IV secretion system protein VirB9